MNARRIHLELYRRSYLRWLLEYLALRNTMVMVMVIFSGYGYGYILGPSPVPPIYLTGSFGLVRPAWI